MFHRLISRANLVWNCHCDLLDRYPLYRAGVLLLTQVLITGRIDVQRLTSTLASALLGYASHLWGDNDPEPMWSPAY